MRNSTETINTTSTARRLLLSGLALATLVSCNNETSAESPIQTTPEAADILNPPTGERTIETAPSTTETLYGDPECLVTDEAVLPGDYSTSLIGTKTEFLFLGVIEDEIDSVNPNATPQEFANIFFDSAKATLATDIDVVIDPSLDLTEWPEDPTATTFTSNNGTIYTEKDNAQSMLLNDLTSIITQLSRYPDELFAAFGVDKIRLANIYTNFGGHYDTAVDELLFEFDNGNVSNRNIYEFLAHELGHAYYDRYCGGNVYNDPELSRYNSIDYIGYAGNEDTQEQVIQHNAKVPPELYSLGQNREFVSSYGASSATEDFATIISHTFSNRGLIQEGDPDFNSPLYFKQQLVFDRLDAMIPGSKQFVENLTTLLRFNKINELHSQSEYPQKQISYDTFFQIVADANNNGSQIALNGIFTNEEWIDAPFMSTMPYPIIESYFDNTEINIPLIITEDIKSYMKIDQADKKAQSFVVFVPASDIVDGQYVGEIFTPLGSLPVLPEGVTAGVNLQTESFDNIAPFKALAESTDWKPIYVEITP